MDSECGARTCSLVDFRGELARFSVEHISDNHLRAFADEESRLGCALAAGAAGDQCDFFFEPIHDVRASRAYEALCPGSSGLAASRLLRPRTRSVSAFIIRSSSI